VQRAVGEHGEGDSLFGVHGQAELVRQVDAEMRQQLSEPLKQQPVSGAAARDNQAIVVRRGKSEAAKRIRDGSRGQLRGGAQQVARAGAARSQEIAAHEPFAKLLPSGALRRLTFEKGEPERSGQQRFEDLPPRRQAASGIVGLPALGEAPHQGVHEHVPGAGIEPHHILWSRASRNQRDVGDAADVQSHGTLPGIPQQEIIDQGHERRALSPRSDVGRAEIRDHGSAGPLCDDGRLGNLERACPPSGDTGAQKRRSVWVSGGASLMKALMKALMKDGLAVRADHR